jgi:hypothetical protein
MSLARILLVVLSLHSAIVMAQTRQPPTVLGLEAMDCAAWIRTKREPELREPYLAWARGFLSGHNYGQPARPVSVISSGTIAAFVDRHCAEKPTSSVDVALMRMSDQFSGRNAPILR